MSEVNQRSWKIPGQRTKRKAWGFTVQVPCDPCPHRHRKTGAVLHPKGARQERSYKSEWTKDDAEKALAEVKLGIKPPEPKTCGLTFGQAAERYLAAKARKRSLDDDRRIIARFKAEFGEQTPLAEITASRISEYKAKRLTTASRTRKEALLSPSAINRPLAILRHLLRIARDEWEVLEVVPKIRLEKEPQGRLRWLTPEDGRRLLEKARAIKPDLADLVEFSLHTGLRQGEALGLTWSDVDRARGVVLLEITKSGRRREVPLNGPADAILARRGDSNKSDEAVFGSRRWDWFRKAWVKAVEEAKLTDFRFHDLRHTFASWAVQRRVTLPELKDLLGHSSLAMVQRYAHLGPEHLRIAVERLDDVLQTAPASAQASAQEQSVEAIEGSR
jgi:integrase